MTTDQVIALRKEAGFVSPLMPLEPGCDPWCVSDRERALEFMVHPDDAFRHLALGFAGRRCEAVGVWPLLNAIQLRVYEESAT